MKIKFIEAKHHAEAKKKAPWSTIVTKQGRSFLAFESYIDYSKWKKAPTVSEKQFVLAMLNTVN